MTDITITASGPVGCGKSAVLGEIEIALKAIGLTVIYADAVGAQTEKNMTHADWITTLDSLRPTIVLREAISRNHDLKSNLR